MGAQLAFLWVGTLKKSAFREPIALYRQRISRYYRIEESSVKDAPGELSPEERAERESRSIEAKLRPTDAAICLDHQGRALSSESFARQLGAWIEAPQSRPCFIVGGAFGLSEALKRRSHLLLSLGPLTLPHDLARLVLLEQIYRAATILHSHPYHH